MGYASTTRTITAARAEQLRAEPRKADYWGRTQTFESKLVDEAVSEWRDQEANRWDSSSAFGYEMVKPMAEGIRDRGIDWDRADVDTAYITPIVAASSVSTVTKKVKVTVPGDVADRLRAPYPHNALEQVRKLLLAQYPANTLGDIEVVSVPAPRKPQAKATEGKAVTKYFIRGAESGWVGDRTLAEALKKPYDSQAEARSAAVDLLTARDTLPALSVEAVVLREAEDGTLSKSLVTIARPTPAEATVTVAVTTHTVKPNAKIDHYEVTFWYHH